MEAHHNVSFSYLQWLIHDRIKCLHTERVLCTRAPPEALLMSHLCVLWTTCTNQLPLVPRLHDVTNNLVAFKGRGSLIEGEQNIELEH